MVGTSNQSVPDLASDCWKIPPLYLSFPMIFSEKHDTPLFSHVGFMGETPSVESTMQLAPGLTS